jgi:hypothetical protein
MSKVHPALQLAAAAALAVTIGMAGTSAKLAPDRPADGVSVIAVTPLPIGDARRDNDHLVRVVIQWRGSNGGDDTPIRDDPF